MDHILTATGLTKSFGPIRAVESLTFSIARGQVLGVLGPNGSGKTTTLALLLGVKRPDRGAFRWFEGITGAEANRRIGSLLEVPHFYPYLSLRQNLELVALARGTGQPDIAGVLEQVGLASRMRSAYYTLSLGMKQRMALASALIGGPEVLVLDEPTNGLDPVGIAQARGIIRQQAALGRTIIMASHILDEVEKVCTHLLILREGRLIAQGPVKALLSDTPLVTIGAENMEQLSLAIGQNPHTSIVERHSDRLLVALGDPLTPATLNQQLMQRGIALSRLETHRKTLEAQFLEMVRGPQPRGNE